MSKVNFEKGSGTFHRQISVSCTVQDGDNVATPHYPVSIKWLLTYFHFSKESGIFCKGAVFFHATNIFLSFLLVISCPSLVTPPNATKLTPSCASVYGSSCLYSCQTGYTSSSGNVTRTCLSSGQWSGNDINCTGNETSQTTCISLTAFFISWQKMSDMVYLLPFSSVFVCFDLHCLFVFVFVATIVDPVSVF